MKELLHVVCWTLFLMAGARAQESADHRYFELRIYSVTAGKLDAVLERFRDTVQPVRMKHGIETAGYWISRSTNEDKFIYLLAASSKSELQKEEKEFGADPDFKSGYAASNAKHGKTVEKIDSLPLRAPPDAEYHFAASQAPRVFELRLYSVLPGLLSSFERRWREHAVPIYARHHLQSVGWWTAEKKDDAGHAVFVCLLAGRSTEAIQESIAHFHQDPDWQRVELETESAGPLRSGVTAFKLVPADFSELK